MKPERSRPLTTAVDAAAPVPASIRTQAGLLLMVVIWALNFSVIKVALEHLSPLAFNALRFPLAALAVWLILRRHGTIPMPRRGDGWRIIALGVLGNVVYQLLFIYGIDRTRAGNAALLLAGSPILTALFSALLGHERLGVRVWGGTVATVVGMALVVVGGPDAVELSLDTVLGDLILVGGSVAWALYTVGARGPIDRYGPIPVTAWTLWIGTVGIVLLGLPDLLAVDWAALAPLTWPAIAYSGILGIGLAYVLWYQGVRHIGNTRTAVFSNLVPVLAMVVAGLWLGEVPGPGQVLGAAIIIGGVLVAAQR